MLRSTLVAALLLVTTSAWAGNIYYVDNTPPGSAATNCTEAQDPATPHNTIAEGIACTTNGNADTVYIRSGTYSERIDIQGPNKQGTAGNYLTIAGYPGETVTIAPTVAAGSRILNVAGKSWFILDNLVVDGINAPTEGNPNNLTTYYNGITNAKFTNLEVKRIPYNAYYFESSSNIEIRNNLIHDLRGCSGVPGDRFYAVYLNRDTNNFLIINNEMYATPGGGIHIYNGVSGAINGVDIIGNSIHGVSTCSESQVGGITIYRETLAITNIRIIRNLIYNNGPSGSFSSAPGIRLDNGSVGIGPAGTKIWNNTIYGNKGWGINIQKAAVSSTVVQNNLVTGDASSDAAHNAINNSGTGTTNTFNACATGESCGTSKLTITDITSCTVTTSNFVLNATSLCVGAGTNTTGLAYNGTADIGAFENPPFSSATIDTNIMDVTLGMSLNTPLLPSTGITGFTVACSGHASCPGSPTVTTAERVSGSDTKIRLTISGISGDACSALQTWTVSYSGTGNLTDSALVGVSTNQPVLAFSTQPVTAVCTGTPTTPPSSGLHIHYKLDEAAGAGTAQDETANNLDGTWTNGPSVTTGKTGNALSFPNGSTEVYLAVPYGNGLTLDSSSLSVCLGVLVHDAAAAQKIVFSADNGTNQRFYIGQIGGTWGIGIKSSGFTTGSEFPVVAEWTRLCLVANSGTDTATLYVNGVKGVSSQVVKSYSGGLTLASNFKVGVGTFSVNYGGSTADDIKIYAATALSDQEVLDDFTAWNAVTPSPTGTFEQKTFKFQGLRVNSSGDPIDLKAAGSNITVVPGGAFELIIQTDCTTANCDPINQRLRFSRNGGTYTAVPDAIAVDNIAFYGTTADPDVVSAAVTCCLTGALTQNDGLTIFTSSAIPNIDLAQNASVVIRYVVKIGESATAGDTYDFRVYNQDGNALDTYTATPRVTIVDMSLGVGF